MRVFTSSFWLVFSLLCAPHAQATEAPVTDQLNWLSTALEKRIKRNEKAMYAEHLFSLATFPLARESAETLRKLGNQKQAKLDKFYRARKSIEDAKLILRTARFIYKDQNEKIRHRDGKAFLEFRSKLGLASHWEIQTLARKIVELDLTGMDKLFAHFDARNAENGDFLKLLANALKVRMTKAPSNSRILPAYRQSN